jgi:hypothetical protein
MDTRISDNVNHGYIAGGNLYLGDVNVAQETLFFEPDLEDVTPPAWTTTPRAEELARALAADRLIVLAGQDLDDKTMVARHLAWLLRERLPGDVTVREWYRSSDPQKIETAFDPAATTILLLPQVLPHNLGHRLGDLRRLLQTRLHYTVITTEGTQEDWGIRKGSPDERLWHTLSWETYYGRSFLAGALVRELAERSTQLPEWVSGDLQETSLLAEHLSVQEAAARLKQPDRIRRFVEWLGTEEASPRSLRAQIDQLGGDEAAIFQWYRRLEPAEQLFALSLALFDGLSDDQIFAAVEYLVDAAWRRTDPNLPLFDYRDLARVGAHFHLAEAGEDGARIETSSRKKREAILRAAWELQRRRLLAVVPALTRLIKQFSPADAADTAPPDNPASRGNGFPAGRPETNGHRLGWRWKKTGKPETSEDDWRFTQGPDRELFSSRRRAEQLQRSVIDSLSQIGLLSFEAVEASFLELAANGSSGVQTIVAKALAAWRGEGHHERLFRVLANWWEIGSRTTLPKALENRNVKHADPLTSIRATVALAVGYALQYDPPNRLGPEILGLFDLAVKDEQPAVRRRVREVTLPLAVASHLQQLEDHLLKRIGRDQEQMYAIAYGVSLAFTRDPEETLKTISEWHKRAMVEEERGPKNRRLTFRDRLLSTVVLAYGYIRDPGREILPPQKIVATLQSVLETETHPFIRAQAIMATGLQGSDHFELVAPILMELISEVTLQDRENVVSVFVRAYLKQREELDGGDGEIESGGKTYQVWLRSQRPPTAIESSLYQWLRDRKQPVARQIAAQTFAAFAATDLERKERSLGVRQEKKPVAAPRPAFLPMTPIQRRLRLMSLFGYLTVLIGAPLRRYLLWPVMAELLAIERRQEGAAVLSAPSFWTSFTPLSLPSVSPVFDRWQVNDDKEVSRLARSARATFKLFRWRWPILLGLILCAALAWDWKIWQDATRTLPLSDTIALQQRRSAPLRLIWNMDIAERRRIVEALAAAEAERQAAIGWPGSAAPGLPRMALSPFEHLRWSAILMNARLANVDIRDLLATLDALRKEIQALRNAAASSTGRAGSSAATAPGPRVRLAPQRKRAEDPEIPEIPDEMPGTDALKVLEETPNLEDLSLKLELPKGIDVEIEHRIQGRPEAAPEATPQSSWWTKVKDKLKKKKPPTGGNNGNG